MYTCGMTSTPSVRTSPPHARSTVARAITVGVLAGFAAGLFGVGGGIVIVPGLVMVAAFEQRSAHATSLAAIVVIATAGAVGYAQAGEVEWLVAAAMTVGGLVGAPIGSQLLNAFSERTLKIGFAVVLVLTALRLVVGGTPAVSESVSTSAVALGGFALLGIAGGVIAGLLGVGGGIITVPALTIIAGLPLVVAKGTSLAVIVPTAAVGTMRNHRAGHVDLRSAVAVSAGGVISAYGASHLSLDLDPELSTRLFAGLLTVTAIRLARRALSTT